PAENRGMQRVHFIAEHEVVMLGRAIILLCTIAAAACSVFAQDAKKSPAAAPAAKGEAKLAALPSPEKLLVGTWRGGHAGKITFQADGTYREFPTWLSVSTAPNAGTVQNAHGTWNLDSHELVISWHVDQSVPLPNGQMQPVTAELQQHYKIARL